jgi:hypothetical protein
MAINSHPTVGQPHAVASHIRTEVTWLQLRDQWSKNSVFEARERSVGTRTSWCGHVVLVNLHCHW